ncbi:hypothetical protein FHL15_001133 [Xylaria flabelliformis]|uniref:Uncharacterized protein n=1 Tax=Xylaria flabelliformis TaxID=2512241 RepID=A0A553ICK1_9PEZI|nr:hypothetical protein FHL15_001133 [Xylaria flabelliformis]
MPQHALDIGRCHCRTARQRYHIKSSTPIPWDARWNTPSPIQAPTLDPGSDFASDMDVSEDSNEYSHEDSYQDSSEDSSEDSTENLLINLPFHGHEEHEDEEVDDEQDQDELSQPLHHSYDYNSNPMVLDELELVAVAPEFNGPPSVPEIIDLTAPPDPEELDPENGGIDDESPEEQVPDISSYRLNLTTLSQRYNIYAAAYAEVIHICRVQSCVDHALPAHPDLVLKPPRSKEAAKVGGYLDPQQPHKINHLIMGDLGDEEILLLACDDGDVLAYYTSQIETALLHLKSSATLNNAIPVKPFFHQNVGISAWGLAIHKKSRLVAVGNNNHEVHVFALALTDPQYTSPVIREQPRRGLFLSIRKNSDGRLLDMSEPFGQSEFIGNADVGLLFRQRQDAYRFILETGAQGNNIPNIAFGSNSEGDAVDILAVDIAGQLWVMNIWSMRGVRNRCFEGLHTLHYKSKFYRNFRRRIRNQPPRGWGVLVLPASSFLPTNTFRESLGLNPAEAVYVKKPEYGYYIGTEKAIKHVKDNSTRHPWVRENKCQRFDTLPEWQSSDLLSEWYDPGEDCDEKWAAVQDKAADKSSEIPLLSRRREEESPQLPVTDGSSVMRTYEMDIELMGGEDNTGIMFTGSIYQNKPPRAIFPGVHFPIERLANLLHVPELSLVVAGSLCGRVVLITLTRPTSPHYSFKRGFRIEAILPKRIDEDNHLRPICPLLGVAIGPIPSAGLHGRLLGERRYRLMLHYYDHRILSYEVYRNMMTSELSVI